MNSPIIDITGLSKFYGKARGIEHVNLGISLMLIFISYRLYKRKDIYT